MTWIMFGLTVSFSWGVPGERFRALTQQTIRELKLKQGGRACDG